MVLLDPEEQLGVGVVVARLRLPAWSAIRAQLMTPRTLQVVTNSAASLMLAAIQPAKPTMRCVPRLPLTANLGLELAGRLILLAGLRLPLP